MKTPFLFLLIILNLGLIGQKTIYYDSLYEINSNSMWGYDNIPLVLDFNDSSSREYILIDSTQPNNIWVFDSINKPGFLVSDSIFLTTGKSGNYDTSNISSFILKLKMENTGAGKGFTSFGLGFVHKFETDSAFDGLIIETSIDGGQTWHDAFNNFNFFLGLFPRWDSIINWSVYTTIPNTYTYIQSGASNGMIYSRIAWGMLGVKSGYDSLLVKISFVSDAVNSNKPGWVIQKLIVEGNFFETGGFGELDLTPLFSIYYHEKTIEIQPLSVVTEKYIITIYNLLGQEIHSQNLTQNTTTLIHLPQIQSGYYLVEINSSKGRMVKKIWIQ